MSIGPAAPTCHLAAPPFPLRAQDWKNYTTFAALYPSKIAVNVRIFQKVAVFQGALNNYLGA
jgi:hypothetical protein